MKKSTNEVKSMTNEMTLFKRFCNTVWEYNASTNQVYMHHNSWKPEWCGEWKSYDECYFSYRNEHICKEDTDIWEHYMLPENLKLFLNNQKSEEHFLVRTKKHGQEVEWHEAYIERISETKVLIGSKSLNEEHKNATITQAAFTEIDYVCRIDIATRNYILYYSGDVRGMAPQYESNDYHKMITEFNKKVVVPEECDTLSKNMLLKNVIQQLETKEEYILYATMRDQDVLTYKKFRFCYADGQKTELLLTRIDISGFVEERKKRELEEKRRIEYLEHMPIGFCATKLILDEEGNPKDFCFTYCNRAHEELHGVAPGELTGKNFYEFYPNGDKKWLDYYYKTAYSGIPKVIREHSDEIGKDLLIRTFQIEEGSCECVVRDVTKENFLIKELQKSRAEMRHILNTTTAIVFQYYPQQDMIAIEELGKADNILILPTEEMIERLIIKGLIDEFYRDEVRNVIKTVRDGEKNAVLTLRARKTIDRPWAWCKMVLFDYQDEETEERKVLGYLQNIDYDVNAQEQLKQLAQTDYTTGLFNVGAGTRRVKELLGKQSEEEERYNAMIILDIDNFKKVNDTLGHMEGDEVLATFGRILKETFRTEDIVYRLGGDEFAIFIEGIQEYESALESILDRFGRELQKARKRYPFLSASIGIFVSNTTKDYQRFYQETDRALYETKRNGKNHCTIRIATKGEVYNYCSKHSFGAAGECKKEDRFA